MGDLAKAAQLIPARRAELPKERAMLVAISGIDGSGKGYITRQIVTQLQRWNLRAVGINADGWLNLPHIRFNPDDPARHFYQHAFRFEEMFSQLILPLKAQRSLTLEANLTEETATEYRKVFYRFNQIEVVVLEGIFLLKPAYRADYDLSFWIDCTFKTALERALKRHQEMLSEEETIRAYQTIYFPAQEIHLAADNPRAAATAIIANDLRLERS